jgi:hypothetical protein
MNQRNRKVRIQFPVSNELGEYLTSLGECLKWTQAATSAALLEEGVKSREKIYEWVGARIMGEVVNAIRGKLMARPSGEPVVYVQAFVDKDVSDAIDRIAAELNNTPARTAAMILESAAIDEGWVIEVVGSGPGRAVVKFFESWKSKLARKRGRGASAT